MIMLGILVIIFFSLLLYMAVLDFRYRQEERRIDEKIERIRRETPEGVEPDFSKIWEDILNGESDDD